MQPNYFQLFNLECSYFINLTDLKKAFFALQKHHHPDAQATQATKYAAIHMSALINGAKKTLEQPAQRALYCCQLLEIATQNIPALQSVIMQQLDWQEMLESVDVHAQAKYAQALMQIQTAWQTQFDALEKAFATQFHALLSPSAAGIERQNQQNQQNQLAKLAQSLVLMYNFRKNMQSLQSL